jgi:hypothetical protein
MNPPIERKFGKYGGFEEDAKARAKSMNVRCSAFATPQDGAAAPGGDEGGSQPALKTPRSKDGPRAQWLHQ